MKSEKAATSSPCLNQRFHASNFRQHEYDAGATRNQIFGVAFLGIAPFYRRLNAVLDNAGFDEFCEAQCHKFYHERLARSFRQIRAISQLLLPLTPPACSHSHAFKLNGRSSQRKVIKLQT